MMPQTCLTPLHRKASKVVFAGIVIALIALLGAVYWQYSLLKLHVAFANGQTQIFSDMLNKALQSDVSGAAGCLRYVVSYYPSGTKQEHGSQLDNIVERDRADAIRDIIAFLRSKTHEDLGTNAEPWIRKHARE